MGNRLSWSTYDKLRNNESLENPSRKRLTENSTPKRRKNTAVEFDKEKLPEEASAWSTNQTVRLLQKNGGQIIKEFLANNEIQRPTRAPRRAKKKPTTVCLFQCTHQQQLTNKLSKKTKKF